jgi:dihydroxy-acid dehydratase
LSTARPSWRSVSVISTIAAVVKEAVREAGGLPFEIRTAAPSDFIISAAPAAATCWRADLIVNDIEIAVEARSSTA